jgi:WD40 repeat protein
VTHGNDPKNERAATFPEAILRHGIDRWPWFDLRGFRNRSGIGIRDYSEERLRLTAALMGPDISAADLIAGWRSALALQRKRQLILRIISGVILLLGAAMIAWLLYLWHNSSIQTRVSNWALASQQLEAGALNRKLDGLAYALASISQKPTADGYASLINAMEPLAVHQRTIRSGGGKAVDVVRFLAHDELLLTAGYTGEAEFWSVTTGNRVALIPISGRAAAIAESPTAPLLAIATSKGVDVLSFTPSATNANPALLQHLDAGDRVRAVIFDHSGNLLLAGAFDGTLTRFRFDHRTRVWRAEKVSRLKDHLGARVAINGLALNWSTRRLIVIDIEGVFYTFDSDRWSETAQPVRDSTEVFGIASSGGSGLIAGSEADGGAVLFDTHSSQIVAHLTSQISLQTVVPDLQGTFRGAPRVEYPRTGIAFSPDGALLATAGFDRTVRIYSTQPRALARIIVEQDATRSVAFSNDHNLVVTGSDNGAVNLWSLSQTVETWRYAGIESVALDEKGEKVAVAGEDGSLQILDSRSGLPLIRTKVEGSTFSERPSLHDLAFTPNSRNVAAQILGSTRVAVWDIQPGTNGSAIKPRIFQHPNEVGHVSVVETLGPGPNNDDFISGEGFQGNHVRVWNAASGTVRLDLRMTGQVFHATAGKEFIVAADQQGELKVWTADDGTEIAQFNLGSTPQDMAVTSSGRRFFVAFTRQANAEGKLCNVLNVQDTYKLSCAPIPLPAAPITSLFSPDGKVLAASVHSSTLLAGSLYVALESRHWHLDQLATQGYTQSLAFSTDGSLLAAGLREGGVIIWDTATETLYASIPLINPVRSVMFYPNSVAQLITLDGIAPGFIRSWQWQPAALIAKGCKRWPYNYQPVAVPTVPSLPTRSQICGR